MIDRSFANGSGKVVLLLLFLMFSQAVPAASAADKQSEAELRLSFETTERDDYEKGPAGMLQTACETGGLLSLTDPSEARRAAFELSKREKHFEKALRYAAIGCEKYHNTIACHNVGSLALWLGEQGIEVPLSFEGELKFVAEFVCSSGVKFKTSNGLDVTGRECTHLANQFALAKDPAWARSMKPAARRFFEAIYAPRRAARLYRTSCERLGDGHACATLRRPPLAAYLQVEIGEAVTISAG